MSAAETRWCEALARKTLEALLPLETRSTRAWEWKVAESAAKPLLAEITNLRAPLRVRERIAYDAEAAMRATLADAKARTKLENELAAVAAADLGRGLPRKKIEATVAKSAKNVVKAWLATQLSIAIVRARKQMARGQKEVDALLSRIAKMDARALHNFANRYNWDDGIFALDAVARHPRCALGTALLVYWLAKPYWYAQWRAASAADDPECFAMLEHIQARIATGRYAHVGIAFDPRKENLTGDTYPKKPKKRALPADVFAATTKSGVVRFEPRR